MSTSKGSDRLDVCAATAGACLRAVNYCLRWGGSLAECAHLLKLIDCAQACRRAAERLAAGSVTADVYLRCAHSCEQCASSCDVFDDLELRECAELCRYCAPVCRRAVLAP
jgi:hypothetical protein